MSEQRPVIKGIFVNSHIKAVQKAKGDAGLAALEQCFGRSLKFSNTENVFVADEVKVIECALDVLTPDLPGDQREFEAGRLHFRNFSTTPFARIIFSAFRKSLKLMLMNASHIAGHVFRGIHFSATELSEKSVEVTMKNNDYAIDHFRGLFYEWVLFAGFRGDVSARAEGTTYIYTIVWN